MSIAIFAGYGQRFLTSKMPSTLPYDLRRSVARGIRVLWFMAEMGGGYLSVQDLRKIGAGQWKALQYVIPDLLHDMLIDEVQLQRRNGRPYSKYKINNAGRQLLKAVDLHVQHEYKKAVERIAAFKVRHGIQKAGRDNGKYSGTLLQT